MTNWHVLPINDLKPHDDTPECWCKPDEKEPGLWVHNSMDRREHTIERGVVQ